MTVNSEHSINNSSFFSDKFESTSEQSASSNFESSSEIARKIIFGSGKLEPNQNRKGSPVPELVVQSEHSNSSTEENTDSTNGSQSPYRDFTEQSSLLEKEQLSCKRKISNFIQERLNGYMPSPYVIPYAACATLTFASSCANGLTASGCNPFDNHKTHDQVLTAIAGVGSLFSIAKIVQDKIESQDTNQNAFVKGTCGVVKSVCEVAIASLFPLLIGSAAVEYRNS